MKLNQRSDLFHRRFSQGCVWLTIILLGLAGQVYPQTLDAFNPAPNGSVYSMAVQPDGKILAVGTFTSLGGQPRTFIGRLNADGTLDPTFNPQIGGYYVCCVAVQTDGKILVGGWFSTLCGQPRGGLGRLNPDGSLDATFADPAADWPVVNSLAVQPDGRIVIGGNFSSLGGQPHFYLARLNADGTQDSTFTTQPDNEVWCVAVQPDGKILVAGYFNYLGGQLTLRIGRLNSDGTVDAGFQPSTDQNIYWVACLGLQADGKILVGGYLNSLGGMSRSNMGRLNPDGTTDSSFTAGSSGWVYSLVPQADGKILVGSTGAATSPHLWRLTAAGALDAGFNAVADNEVFSITLQPDGKVLVSGDFANLAGGPCNFLGRLLNTDPATQNLTVGGTSISWLRGGTSPEVWRTTFDASTNGTNWAALGDGTRISGGWQLSGVAVPTNSTIRARGFVAGGYQNGLSWVAEASIGPLLICAQPLSLTNNAATPAAFSVTAAGTPPLSYQWLKDGTNLVNGGNLSGAHEPTLILNSVFEADGGGYSVIVSNASMCITSQVATLTVVDPLITSQPTNQVTDAGQAVVFAITAAGTPPLVYQWFKEGVSLSDGGNIIGSQTPTLTLTNVSGADRGDYWVVLTNSFGSLTSLVASLSVNDPFISTQPASQVTNSGETVSFSVLAGGTVPLSYQWRKYGVGIPDATAETLTLTNVQWADTGGYDVVVTNIFGAVTSSVASLAFPTTPDSFNPGANGTVYCLAVQPDGKVLVGGSFTSLGGQARTNIGRLNADGTLDLAFNPGAQGYAVYCLSVALDGKVLVGGGFTALGGQARSNLGRLNGDGTLDTSFTPSANSAVYTLGLQPDGKTLVGGIFTSLSGQARNYIGRLNGDGTLDVSFNPGADGAVTALALQADGCILVGGDFSILTGQARSYIGRLNGDGTLDAVFNPGASSGINSLALQADGRIVVGGGFTTLAGQACSYLGRLNPDGTLDSGFNPGADTAVYALAALANGQILAAGPFTLLGGQTRNYLGRINPDGTLDTTFNPGANGSVYSLAVQPDGNLLVGGDFTTVGGLNRASIARLNGTELATQNLAFDGSSITWSLGGASPGVARVSFEATTNGVDWLTLGAATYLPGAWQLSGLSLPTNSAVRARGFVAGGNYDGSDWYFETSVGPPAISIPPTSRTNLAWSLATFTVLGAGTPPINYQWCKNGSSLADGGNTYGSQTSTLTLSNVLGGDMGSYSVIVSNVFGAVTSRVAILSVVDPLIAAQPLSLLTNLGQTAVFNVTATGTAPFGYQWRKNGVALASATGSSLTLTNVQWTDGGNYDVLVSNNYGTNTSTPATLALPAVLDTLSPSCSGPVYALAVQTDGKILVGGSFGSLGGQLRNNIGRLLPNGTLDTGFNPNAGNTVYSLAVQTDGRVLLGGLFPTLGGQACPYIGRINADGTLDAAFNPGPNTNVNAIVIQPDGKIVVGGGFTNLCGQTRNFIGRLNADGTLDTTFNSSASGIVYSLALQPDGKLLVGGAFTGLGGQACNYIGRLNADGTLDAAFNPGASSTVFCLAVQADGRIVAGGNFTILAGQTRSYIGRINADGTPDGSFNPGANGIVYSLALQADGKLFAGGIFTTLGGQTRRYVGRLNPDGTLDNALNPGPNGIVYALALQTDGSILAGGSFSSFASQSRTRLARLSNTYPATQGLAFDGTNITWLRNGASPEVWQATFDASTNGSAWLSLGSGARIPGGWQMPAPWVPVNSTVYARGWVSAGYESGSSWFLEASVGPPAIRTQPASLTNNSATTATFAVAAAGTLPLGYQWFRAGAALSDGGNISGSLSSSLTVSNVLGADAAQYWVVITNASGSVTSLVATLSVVDPCLSHQPVSRTNNAGTTTTFSVQAAGTAQLNYQWYKGNTTLTDTGNRSGTRTATLTLTNVLGADMGNYQVTISNALGSVTSAVATLSVNDPFITNQPTNQFTSPGQTAVFSVSANGTAPMGYQWCKNGAPLAGATGSSLTLTNAQRADIASYDVLVTNSFTVVTSAIATLTVNLALPDSLNPSADGMVQCLAVQTDGKILLGGSFQNLGGQPCTNMGRLNADGTLDTNFCPGVVGSVYALAVQTDSKILVGGYFLTAGGRPFTNLCRLNPDGSLESTFNPAPGGWVSSLAIQSDGKILVAGGLTSLAGQPRTGIGRLNPDGSLDTNFVGNVYPSAWCMALQPDGKILVGGLLSSLDGNPCSYLGRLNADGTGDTGFAPSVSYYVDCLAVQPDGKILVGGYFTTLAGQPCNYIGRLNPDGTLENAFSPGANNYVSCMALQADAKILVGGWFTSLAGQPRANIGRLNGDGTLDLSFNPGAGNQVSTLAVQVDGATLAGGTFTTLDGQARNYVGRLASTDAATQNLVFASSTITWGRSGAGPDFWRTTFEASTNGADWTNLGPGTHIPGGWQLSGVSLPPNALVRARGFLTGGGYTSAWFVETVLAPDRSLVIENDGSLGFPAHQFGFTLSATIGRVVVIEASTNLAQWIAIQTNVVTSSGLIFFTDPESSSLPRRYYRARYYDGSLPPPAIGTAGGAFGFQTNGFGFNLSGVAGQTVVIESSTNLVNWTALATNSLDTNLLYFSDPGWTNFTMRFYRARVR